MLVPNSDVAAVFSQIADLLEIEGKNAFRVRACRNAARTIGTLTGSVQAMLREQRDLTELPDIGADLAAKIAGQARRGWLEKGDVLNTRPPGEMRTLLAGVRARGRA